jgi:hypothetical protein
MRPWRAGCGGTRTSGSEGGGGETSSRKADTALRRRPLHIQFDPEAANLMFSLVSARYERACLIVTSNKPFSAWGEIFGDEVTAVAMIDRLVHHAEILSLKGDSYRLQGKDLGAPARHERPAAPTPPRRSGRRRAPHHWPAADARGPRIRAAQLT